MASITGYGSKHSHEFTLEVNETGTSVANNTSDISFNFSLYKASYSWSGWNSITYTVNINGTEYEGTIPNYSAGNTLNIKSGSQTIQHNADGKKTINISFSVVDESGQSYTCGNASASGSMVLTDIPRYATVSQSLRNKTSSSISINWSSDSVIDYIWYSSDNGSHWSGIDITDGSSGNYTISNLSPNTTYNIKTRVRRKDSGLTTDSSALSIKTYAQTIPTISLTSKTSSSITVSSGCNVAVSSTKYRIKKTSGSYGNYQNSSTFSGLQPNTAYTIEVNKTATESGESGTATINVTTYAKTVPTISLSSKTVDSITVSSGCNVAVSSTKYRIKKTSGSYGNYQNSSTFSGLQPNTAYTIEVNKTATESRESGTATINVTTYDIAKISSIADFEHGNNTTINITNPGSINNLSLVMKIGTIQIFNKNVNTGTNTISFSDTELDILYKQYQSSITLTATFILTGKGYTNSKECMVIFNGNQKTVHIKQNEWKRGKLYIKVNNSWKRAVIWQKDNGTWKRSI